MSLVRDTRGFSLVEMLIVIGIIAILLAVAAMAFGTWVTKYNIEAQVQELYAELIAARTRALYRNVGYFMTFPGATSYQVTEDTNGDGAPGAGDAVILIKPLRRAIATGGAASVIFDGRGIANQTSLCFLSNVSPDYDCVVIDEVRINTGKIVNQGVGCAVANCLAK